MEDNINVCAYPMTDLEKQLKRCFFSRPDLRDKILTPEELSAYILWLVTTQRPLPTAGNAMETPIARILLSAADTTPPAPTALKKALAACFSEQDESRYLPEKKDISLDRMMRYMPAHWHTSDSFELYYVFSGECPIHFPGETVVCHPGSVLIAAPGALHATPCYGDDRVLMTSLVRASTFERVFWNQLNSQNLMSVFFRQALHQGGSAAYLWFDAPRDRELEDLLTCMEQELSQELPYSSQMVNTLMSAFFLLLLRRYEQTAQLPRTGDLHWKREFSALFQYIQEHAATASLPEIAARFHYSERQISRIVKMCTGMNYAHLITKLRMEKAALLLKQSSLTMDEIAAAVGYSGVSSFYRAFEQYYSCSPGSYRKTNL
ncbi:MAG: helix-turn-helix domain-containing protein [Oscillospiraceae bacterium]|uniref:Helix-turn-helix domain-containing protein n=1 Tax=Candidatus Pullilachnospira gallistercoris TaxID=2840911 RepID=A0A9D1E893_9FIRM|nr:helix-turn-helix domain-containing protein [Candidatus Pullilachnospira gallistercoris]